MGRKQGVKLPEIPWAQDDHKLVWDLITQLEKDVNYKVLFGKKVSSEVSNDKSFLKVQLTYLIEYERGFTYLCV